MKQDGITLLDDSGIQRKLSEDIGTTFPETPDDGQPWELTETVGEFEPGTYLYSAGTGTWFKQNRTENNPYDMAIYVAGIPRVNDEIVRVNIVRAAYFDAGLGGSQATAKIGATVEQVLPITLIRGGSTTAIGTITFAVGSLAGVIAVNAPYDTNKLLVIQGDQVVISSTEAGDATLSDLSVTFLSNLVTVE